MDVIDHGAQGGLSTLLQQVQEIAQGALGLPTCILIRKTYIVEKVFFARKLHIVSRFPTLRKAMACFVSGLEWLPARLLDGNGRPLPAPRGLWRELRQGAKACREEGVRRGREFSLETPQWSFENGKRLELPGSKGSASSFLRE